jgi:predicted murein hydrolase (TIGR00659 family)
MTDHLTTLLLMTLTVGTYLIFRAIYMRYNHPLINVVALSVGVIIAVMMLFGAPYSTYVPGKNIMTFMLGPATVALAVPLYLNRHLLRKHGLSILISVALGSAVTMISAGLLGKLCGMPKQIVISLIPKGVTIPFAVEISRIYGGEPAITTAFVVATGTLGGVIGLSFLTWARITNPVARGLSMGTVAHGQGTAMSFMEGYEQGAMAGLAMTLAGIMTAALAPFVMIFFI